MNYRMTNEFRPPVRIFAFLEQVNATQLDLTVKIRAEVPSNNYVGSIIVNFSVPRTAAGVTSTLGTDLADYDCLSIYSWVIIVFCCWYMLIYI